MKYADLLDASPGAIGDKVLVWSENYETAVFELSEEVHPATKWIWFQLYPYTRKPKILKTIFSHKRIKGLLMQRGKPVHLSILEECDGEVPYKNEVVFTKHPKGLHTASAAGNTAEAVFPQNKSKIYGRAIGKNFFQYPEMPGRKIWKNLT